MKKNKKIFLILIAAILISSISFIAYKQRQKPLFETSDVRFRFYMGPRRGYYYPYYRNHYYYDDYYSRVELFVYDNKDKIVEEVYINGRTVYQRDSYRYRENVVYFTLRSGYYTISWRVRSSKFFKNQVRVHSRRIRIHPYERYVPITIKGDKLYY
ncbi:MAG: hypothetical protein K1060chlam5_01197 [Candidatus Anoxychlamydiales bacterium]|nr:hypothetical protein [Candidatus Anoxychlamydiales bacterium]